MDHLEVFLDNPSADYLTAMAQNGAHGDQLTLQAAAEPFNFEILVVSSLGPDVVTVISVSDFQPSNCQASAGSFCRGSR